MKFSLRQFLCATILISLIVILCWRPASWVYDNWDYPDFARTYYVTSQFVWYLFGFEWSTATMPAPSFSGACGLILGMITDVLAALIVFFVVTLLYIGCLGAYNKRNEI